MIQNMLQLEQAIVDVLDELAPTKEIALLLAHISGV